MTRNLNLFFKSLLGMWKTYRNPSKGIVRLPWGGGIGGGGQTHMPAPRRRRHVVACSHAGSRPPSETLANQPARGEANKQPSYPPARQSASQPAIRMPFRHLLLPAMRLSLFPSPPSLPSFPLSFHIFSYFSLHPFLFPFRIPALGVCTVMARNSSFFFNM